MKYNVQNIDGQVIVIFGLSKVKKQFILEQSFFDGLNSLMLQTQFNSKTNDIVDFFNKFLPTKLEVISIYEKTKNKRKIIESHHILYAVHQGITYKFDYYFEYKNSFTSIHCSTKKKVYFSAISFYKRVRLSETRKLVPNGYLSVFNYLDKQFGIYDKKYKQSTGIIKRGF